MSTPMPLHVEVARVIPAPPDLVYDVISDITRMPEFSPETTATRWVGDADRATVGARSRGTNTLARLSWSTKPTIVAADRGHRFAFEVPGRAGPIWTYEFQAVDGGTLVTESMRQDRPSPPTIRFLQRRAGVHDRSANLEHAMTTTLDRLAAAINAPIPA